MRGKEGNSTNPTKFLPLHFVKLAALASLVKDNIKMNFYVVELDLNFFIVTKDEVSNCPKCQVSESG